LTDVSEVLTADESMEIRLDRFFISLFALGLFISLMMAAVSTIGHFLLDYSTLHSRRQSSSISDNVPDLFAMILALHSVICNVTSFTVLSAK
jgi:hypothetical protein